MAPELNIHPLHHARQSVTLLISGGKNSQLGFRGSVPVRALPRCDCAQMSQEFNVKSRDSSPSKGLDKASPLPAMMSSPLLSPTVKVSIKSYETLVQRKKEGEQRALQSLGRRFAWMFSNHGVHEGLGVGNTPSLSSLSITFRKYGQLARIHLLGEVLQMRSFPALQAIAAFKSTGLSPSLLPPFIFQGFIHTKRVSYFA